ncbi:MAG: phage major capsid protein [Anaerolineae bacterium]|nr:phage major capsid protein [Anaerolineae bacterium]
MAERDRGFADPRALAAKRAQASGSERLTEQDAREIEQFARQFDAARAVSKVDHNVTEVSARLATLEQMVAGAVQSSTGLVGGRGGFSPGAQALIALQDDPFFLQAAQAGERGARVSQFSARANLDTSIRAALTNEYGSSSDGGMPSAPERGGIYAPVVRPLTLLDVLPHRAVANDAVEFVQMRATGDAAEQEHEGDEKAIVAFSGELVRVEIATVAGWMPSSKQVLSDHVALQAVIDRVIRNKVLAEFERLLINGGSGSSGGRIRGLVEQAMPFIPAIGDSRADIIGEALMWHASAGYRASVIVLNPIDWYRLQIERTATERAYLFGSPVAPLLPSLWNAQVVLTSSIEEDTALTIDPAFVTILDREQLGVQVSNQHADYFTRNLVAILGELRGGLEVTDPRAVFKFELSCYVSSEESSSEESSSET